MFNQFVPWVRMKTNTYWNKWVIESCSIGFGYISVSVIDRSRKDAYKTSSTFIEACWHIYPVINTLRPRQNGRHFVDDTLKRIFMNENVRISTKISLKFVPKGLINNIQALVQIMAWRRPGDKPLSEPMLVSLPTHIWVTRPQWVNEIIVG